MACCVRWTALLMRFEAAVSGATFRTTDIPITVKLRTEATTYNSTNCLDRRPVSGTRRLCRTRLLSNHFEVVNFCSRWASYCMRLTLLEITASEKYSMPVANKWCLADFQKPFLKTSTSKRHYHGCVFTVSKSTRFPLACICDLAFMREPASDPKFLV